MSSTEVMLVANVNSSVKCFLKTKFRICVNLEGVSVRPKFRSKHGQSFPSLLVTYCCTMSPSAVQCCGLQGDGVGAAVGPASSCRGALLCHRAHPAE